MQPLDCILYGKQQIPISFNSRYNTKNQQKKTAENFNKFKEETMFVDNLSSASSNS